MCRTFILVILFVLIFIITINLKGIDKYPTLYLKSYVKDLSYVDLSVRNASEAKQKQLWWLSDDAGNGLAIGPVSSHSPLLSTLFPGYDQKLSVDAEFWKRYFTYEFEPTVQWLENDDLGALGFNVMLPWLACFDVYEHYGADVIIFGSSEVYKAVIPKALGSIVSKSFSKPLRILHCGTGSMAVTAVKNAIYKLQQLRPGKLKAVLWGYSFWSVVQRDEKRGREDILNSYKSLQNSSSSPSDVTSADIDYIHFKGSQLFPTFNWNMIMPLSYDLVRRSLINLPEGLIVPRFLYGNETKLQDYIQENYIPFYPELKKSTEKDCDLSQARKELSDVFTALKGFAELSFVYLTPTTPEHHAAAPTCLRSEVKKMLVSEGQDNIFIRVEEMPSYQLLRSDFLRPNFDRDQFYFDPNHVNHDGAKKVTQALGEWMSSEIFKQ